MRSRVDGLVVDTSVNVWPVKVWTDVLLLVVGNEGVNVLWDVCVDGPSQGTTVVRSEVDTPFVPRDTVTGWVNVLLQWASAVGNEGPVVVRELKTVRVIEGFVGVRMILVVVVVGVRVGVRVIVVVGVCVMLYSVSFVVVAVAEAFECVCGYAVAFAVATVEEAFE
jgi:hypothetical protein